MMAHAAADQARQEEASEDRCEEEGIEHETHFCRPQWHRPGESSEQR
jgi:hypothetical protein